MATPPVERALARQAGVLRIEDDAVATILGKPENPGSKTPPQPAEILPWGIDRERFEARLCTDGTRSYDGILI